MAQAPLLFRAPRGLFLSVMLLSGCGWVDDGVDGNEPPRAHGADYEVVVGEQLLVPAEEGVLQEASDPGGRPLEAALESGPEHAQSFTLNADGSFEYVHDGGDSTADSFHFVASDGIDPSEPTEVTIHVHQYPTVSDQSYEVVPGTPRVVEAPGVLQGAADLNGDPLRAVKVEGEGPLRGTLTLNEDGSFVYEAPLTTTGADSFRFYASDGKLASEPATVTLNITPVAKPSAVADRYDIDVGGTLEVPAPGVLANDSSPRNGTMTAELLLVPTHAASFALQPDGSFVYQHNGDTAIEDEFTYRALDPVPSDPTTVTIGINQPPVAANDGPYPASPGVELRVDAGEGVLANDTDPNGAVTLTAELVQAPAQGTLTLAADGSFSYLPPADASGTVSFTYRARDGSLASAPATVSIEVTPQAPTAAADSYTANEGETLQVAAPGVLGNDSGPPGASLRARLVAEPSSAASFTLNPDGSFSYTPDDSAATEDSFRYYAYYTTGGVEYPSEEALVTLDIVRQNEAPVAMSQCTDTRFGQPVTLSLQASDRETPPRELVYEVPAESEGGALVLESEGWNGSAYQATYVARAEAPWGTHPITYTVTDTGGASDTADVHVVLRPRIMPLGDSITLGKGDGRSDPAGYRVGLWNRMGADGYRVDFAGGLANGPDDMDRDHEGHSGIRTQSWGDTYDANRPGGGISENVDSWLSSNPADFVLLHIGTNDLNTGIAPASTDLAIGDILAKIDDWAASHRPVEVFLAQIIDFLPSEPKVAELNALLANRVSGDRLVDQYGALRKGGAPDPALYDDRLHPNSEGYEAMADAWYRKLEPLLSDARCPASI